METEIREALRETDEALVPFAALVQMISDVEYRQVDERMGMALTVEAMTFDFPFEVSVRVDGRGRVTLDAAPPTQELETSTMPVFHRLRVTVSRDGPG